MTALPAGGTRIITGERGSSAEVTIRVSEITRAHELAFLDANLRLENLAKREVKLVKWAWPVDPSPRDVVDRGGLGSSIQAIPEGPTSWVHAVNVNYAAPVLLGYRVRTRKGYRNMPGRNIYREPLETFSRAFTNAFRRRSAT